MSKTQDIVWPSGSAFLPGLSATGSCGFRLNLELLGPLTSDNRPCRTALELVGGSRLITYLLLMETEKWKKRKKEKLRKIDRTVTTRPTHKPPENFKSLPNAGTNVAADTTRIHPVRQDLVGRCWWGCVSVWAKARAPERPGERRQEGGVSFGSHKSTFKWSLIPEHHRKWDKGKGWGRMAWIPESTRQCFSLLLGFGLVGFVLFLFPPSPNCKVCICDQRREETFCKPEQHRFFFCSFYFIVVDTIWGRAEILARRKKL